MFNHEVPIKDSIKYSLIEKSVTIHRAMESFEKIAFYLSIAVALVYARSMNIASIDDVSNDMRLLGTREDAFGKLVESNVETKAQMDSDVGENSRKFETPDAGDKGTQNSETRVGIEGDNDTYAGAEHISSADLRNLTIGTGVDLGKGTEFDHTHALHEKYEASDGTEHHSSESSGDAAGLVRARGGIEMESENDGTTEEEVKRNVEMKSDEEVSRAVTMESRNETRGEVEEKTEAETKRQVGAKSEMETKSEEEVTKTGEMDSEDESQSEIATLNEEKTKIAVEAPSDKEEKSDYHDGYDFDHEHINKWWFRC